MKTRMVEEHGFLFPYVVCGGCDEVVRGGEKAVMVRKELGGDVEGGAFHEGCVSKAEGCLTRPLHEWLTNLVHNSCI